MDFKPILSNSVYNYSSNSSKIDLVISHYNEDLSLYEEYFNNFNVYIYYKGNIPNIEKKPNINFCKLPNKGINLHSYLYHIITNYHKLSDITLFCLGSGWREDKKIRKTKWILDESLNIEVNKPLLFAHNFNINYDVEFKLDTYYGPTTGGIIKNVLARKRPLNNWIEYYTGHKIGSSIISFGKDTFGVTKEMIRLRDIKYWKKMFSQACDSIQKHDIEVAHYFERSWLYVFMEKLNYKYLKSAKQSSEKIKEMITYTSQ